MIPICVFCGIHTHQRSEMIPLLIIKTLHALRLKDKFRLFRISFDGMACEVLAVSFDVVNWKVCVEVKYSPGLSLVKCISECFVS